MKNAIFLKLLLLIFAFPSIVSAQYSLEVITSTQRPYYLVGSLAPNSLGNAAKLQIDILGGGWTTSSLGITTFYVGNRDAFVIHQVTMGSGADHYAIKAYANPNGNTDIYITTNQDYAAFSIKSCMIQGNSTVLQTITAQTPVGTDITPVVLPVLITDQYGNIGINTTDTKGYKFAVNGSVVAVSVNIKPYANWPDYVFKPTYQLLSLADVKTYIDQNQHLPEMPSAADVAKDGINVGQMNTLLTKKVEELTLYMIEKDKTEKEQSATLKSQQQQIEQQNALIKAQQALLLKLQQNQEELNKKVDGILKNN